MQLPVGYRISTARDEVQFEAVYAYIAGESYWAQGRSREVMTEAIENSFCCSVFYKGEQVGFARAVTDYATFAYLADVYVLTAHRGKGLSKAMMEAILYEPKLSTLRRWILATFDAHGLYAQFGFTALERPDRFMQRLVER